MKIKNGRGLNLSAKFGISRLTTKYFSNYPRLTVWLNKGLPIAMAIGLIGAGGILAWQVVSRASNGQLPACNSIGHVLTANNHLTNNQCLISPNGKYAFIFQSDGNAVLYKGSDVLWTNRTDGSGASMFFVQGDGLLAQYTPDWKPVWYTPHEQTLNKGGAVLNMQDDGNLVLYTADYASAVWFTNTMQPQETVAQPTQQAATPPCNSIGHVLSVGNHLSLNQCLISPNGQYAFILQGDGNAVLYKGTAPIWYNLGRGDSGGTMLYVQADGLIAEYTADWKPVWYTPHEQTLNKGGSNLVMQDDGNLVLYNADYSQAIWNTQALIAASTAKPPSNNTNTGNNPDKGKPTINNPNKGTITVSIFGHDQEGQEINEAKDERVGAVYVSADNIGVNVASCNPRDGHTDNSRQSANFGRVTLKNCPVALSKDNDHAKKYRVTLLIPAGMRPDPTFNARTSATVDAEGKRITREITVKKDQETKVSFTLLGQNDNREKPKTTDSTPAPNKNQNNNQVDNKTPDKNKDRDQGVKPKIQPTLRAKFDPNPITIGRTFTFTVDLKLPEGESLNQTKCVGTVDVTADGSKIDKYTYDLRYNASTKTCQKVIQVSSKDSSKISAGKFTASLKFPGNAYLKSASYKFTYEFRKSSSDSNTSPQFGPVSTQTLGPSASSGSADRSGRLLLYSDNGRYDRAMIAIDTQKGPTVGGVPNTEASCGSKVISQQPNQWIIVELSSGAPRQIRCSASSYFVNFFRPGQSLSERGPQNNNARVSPSVSAEHCTYVHKDDISRIAPLVNGECPDSNKIGSVKQLNSVLSGKYAPHPIKIGRAYTYEHELKLANGEAMSPVECAGQIAISHIPDPANIGPRNYPIRYNPTTKSCTFKQQVSSSYSAGLGPISEKLKLEFAGNSYLKPTSATIDHVRVR